MTWSYMYKNPKESTRNLLELTGGFRKVTGYKVVYKNNCTFIYYQWTTGTYNKKVIQFGIAQ